jgi:predicted RNA-binding protein with PUA-like domain
MKTEPESYSIDDLARDKRTSWDGVRNYQARNFMRDGMKLGDEILIYHSSADPPGVAGLAKVCRLAYPDATAQDPRDHHFDPKATPDNPIWLMVDLAFVEKFEQFVTLEQLRGEKSLANLLALKRGQRLSIQPVERKDFDRIVAMGRSGAKARKPTP